MKFFIFFNVILFCAKASVTECRSPLKNIKNR